MEKRKLGTLDVSLEQVRANSAALGWRLTPEELREIDRLVPPSAEPAA